MRFVLRERDSECDVRRKRRCMAGGPERERRVDQPTVQHEWDTQEKRTDGASVQTCVDMASGRVVWHPVLTTCCW